MVSSQILIVDLDDTLVKSDLLYESVFAFLRTNPFRVFQILYWFLKGGPLFVKNRLATCVHPRVDLLPFRHSVLEIIDRHKKAGFKVGLVSASPQKWVERIAHHLGVFDFYLGSGEVNLKGLNKHEAIVRLCGTQSYTYIGDSKADFAIWKKCGRAIAVNLSETDLERLRAQKVEVELISDQNSSFSFLVKQMRIHQWAKNSLLFLPMIAAHKLNLQNSIQTLVSFFAFSFAASSVYVLNDLIDIDSDRSHHSKKNRPLASGALGIKPAIQLFFLLALLSLSISGILNVEVLAVILCYYLMNFLYTFYFKKEVVLDIILLSGMYTVRLFAGAAAAQAPVSSWLLSFSTFFFFSLACVKRYTELARSQSRPTIDGRGYRGVDQSIVQIIGVGTGLLSIVVALLYIQTGEVNKLYSQKELLWLVNPLLLYWIGRLWLLTGRNEINDDPVIFAIKDKMSWICGLILVTIFIFSI